MNKETLATVLIVIFRAALNVGIGFMQGYINTNSDKFGGLKVDWLTHAAFISNVASVLALLAIGWWSAHSHLAAQKQIKTLTSQLVQIGVTPATQKPPEVKP